MKKLKQLAFITLASALIFGGCQKDEYNEVVGVCPIVVSTIAADKAVNVPLNQVVSATFNEKMNSETITDESFTLLQGETKIAGANSYNNVTASLAPSSPLLPFKLYTGRVTTSAKDPMGNALQEDYVWTFTTIPEVLLSSLPIVGGTTSGAGTFNQDSLITITAIPASGYSFLNWTDNGTVVSTSAVYEYAMAGNKALVANYTLQLVVATSSNPTAGGTTLGAGSFDTGTSVTLSAKPNTGYNFVNWTENEAIVSTNADYEFQINVSRTLEANFELIVLNTYTLNVQAVNGEVLKVPNLTDYSSGALVQLTATPNTGYEFTSWSGDTTGIANPLTVKMNSNKNITANFTATVNTYTLNVQAVNGTVVKNPDLTDYNSGAIVELTATPNDGFKFDSWSGDVSGNLPAATVTMNANKNVTANFITLPPIGPQAINLGTAGNFSILTMSGISSTGITAVGGNIGVSPAAAAAITGFGLIMDTNGQSSHTTIATHVTGKVYSSDYAPPTPSNLTVAVADMLTAYTTANNLVTPAPILEQGAGDLSGLTLAPGLYKWGTGVLIADGASVTLSGGPNDTWIFQIAQDLTLNSSAQVKLIGGAQAKNITWVVAGQAVLGTNAVLYGNILSKTLISLNTGSKVTGKLLAQTAVTLNTSTVIEP